MEKLNEYYQYIMLYFRKEKNATQTAEKISNVYRTFAEADRVVQKWHTWFRNGEFEFENRRRSGASTTIDTAMITTVVNENPHLTLHEFGDIVEISHVTVQRHFQVEDTLSCRCMCAAHTQSQRASIVLLCDQLYRTTICTRM